MVDKEYSVKELIDGLNKKEFTSRDLVDFYIERILTYDRSGVMLNSIAEINPEVYEIADILDLERSNGKIRSIMHGIPIVIKDNINTKDKMHTSASSIALENFYAPEDAFVIKKLRDAGVIILGKTNLSEFAYFMSFDNMPSGYGSRFGQVKSPYSKNIDPLGSSTGSAVAVASNLIAVSIGTETNGSLTAPAKNNSISTIKPTVGMVSRSGIIPISHHQDTAGPLGRSIEDCAYLLQIIYGYDSEDLYTHHIDNKEFNFIDALKKDIRGKKVGFVKYTNLDYNDEEKEIEKEAKDIFEAAGCEVLSFEIENKKMPNHITLIYDFKVDLNHYLAKYRPVGINSLKDLISFNNQDSRNRLKYGQSIFTAAEKTSGALTEVEYFKVRKENLEVAGEYQKLLEENNLDVLVSVVRSSHAPIFGNPVIAIPAKPLIDDEPRSLFFIGKKFDDENIIAFANLYEKKTLKRLKPDLKNIR
ncbi:MAG: amidase family protein [Candidatus Izemoplasmatales bacterium]|nr:amidase family protein [Candidatus Izemoplasmatales bacterium]